jgi:hypothetical protein
VIFLPLSYFVKESILVLAPVAAWAWKVSGRRFRDPWFAAGALVALGGWWAASKGARALAPEPVSSFTVTPSLNTLGNNLLNVVSLVFFFAGIAPVVIFALIEIKDEWFEGGPRRMLLGPAGPELVGFALLLLVNLYSLVSTDLTLRTGWLLFPFAISLSARWFDRVDQRRFPGWLTRVAAASPT